MENSVEILVKRLKAQFDSLTESRVICDQAVIALPPEHLLTVCQSLKEEYGFEQLVDICGVDYTAFGQADWETQSASSTGFSRGVDNAHQGLLAAADLAVVYHLLSLQNNIRLRLRCRLNTTPARINSVIDIWASANWYEREAFDLFGILFDGHPDLRRILTDYGFIGHPMRKDFPLQGNVEVRYDAEQQRVVYQPVTISNRVLVPRVIRHDRYDKSVQGDKDNA